MNDAGLTAGSWIAMVLVIVGIAWSILAFCIPFMLYSILGYVKELRDIQKKQLDKIANIETNVYNCTVNVAELTAGEQ